MIKFLVKKKKFCRTYFSGLFSKVDLQAVGVCSLRDTSCPLTPITSFKIQFCQFLNMVLCPKIFSFILGVFSIRAFDIIDLCIVFYLHQIGRKRDFNNRNFWKITVVYIIISMKIGGDVPQKLCYLEGMNRMRRHVDQSRYNVVFSK